MGGKGTNGEVYGKWSWVMLSGGNVSERTNTMGPRSTTECPRVTEIINECIKDTVRKILGSQFDKFESNNKW